MKNKIVALYAATVFLFGCTTPNPAHVTDASQPAFIPDAKIAQLSATAHEIVNSTAPINPYTAPLNLVIDGAAAIVTAVSLAFARKKSADAEAHKLAADSLAETVVKSGNTVAALQIAALNKTADAVALHLDNNSNPTIVAGPSPPKS